VGLCCYESSIRPYKVFLAASLPTLIAASCRLYSRHYCRLDSSSHRKTCGVIAVLIDLYSGVIATPTYTPVGLCCYGSSMRRNLSRLRHHCRLDLYYSGIIATPTLMWYYAASCSSMRPNLISFAASCRLKSSSCRTTYGIIANLICRLVGRLAASLPACD
jgi:hypothetical protein